MSEMLREQEKFERQQKQFARQEIISEKFETKQSKGLDPDDILLTLRCTGKNCKKVLGKVNTKGQLITESKRSGSWIKTIMEKGFVKCKKCGNLLSWDSQKLNRR